MDIKTISLVILDPAEADWLIPATCAIACACDAHLVGLHAYTPAVFFVGAEPNMFLGLQEWQKSHAAKMQSAFDEATRRNDLRAEFRRQDKSYGAQAFLLTSSRSADLVVMGSTAFRSRSPDDRRLAEQVIRQAGRPVLVLPEGAAPNAPVARLVIGWSDTREAARAAHDALSLARPGASIDIVSVLTRAGEDGPGLNSRDDFATALDRRGYKVTTLDRAARSENRADELLATALERNADLLVTGAFGHSDVYDFVIGAVTRQLLEEATVPVLFSK